MNHSINYAGFIDLAISFEREHTAAIAGQETENCKPAYAMQLLDESSDGTGQIMEISNPIGKRG